MKLASHFTKILFSAGALLVLGCGDDIRSGFEAGNIDRPTPQGGSAEDGPAPDQRAMSLMEGIDAPIEFESKGSAALAENIQSVRFARSELGGGEIEITLTFDPEFAQGNLVEGGRAEPQQTFVYSSEARQQGEQYFLEVLDQSSSRLQSVATCESQSCQTLLVVLQHPDLRVGEENLGAGYLYFLAEEDPEGGLQIQDSNSATALGTAASLKDQTQDLAQDAQGVAEQVAQEAEESPDEAVEQVAQEAEESPDEAVEQAAQEVEESLDGSVEQAAQEVEESLDEAGEQAEDLAEQVQDGAQKALEDVQEGAESLSEDLQEGAEGAAKSLEETAEEASEQADDVAEDVQQGLTEAEQEAQDTADVVGDHAEDLEQNALDDAGESAEPSNSQEQQDSGSAPESLGLGAENSGGIDDEVTSPAEESTGREASEATPSDDSVNIPPQTGAGESDEEPEVEVAGQPAQDENLTTAEELQKSVDELSDQVTAIERALEELEAIWRAQQVPSGQTEDGDESSSEPTEGEQSQDASEAGGGN